ncbi:glycoside hydrolase family 51 protein [Oidiodendron maius Zn]|uniref:non-reducing end alpha-L-arabinofuranosidase n=1 Tax=Oidiodendron maius (strain Zn) TaxID=913774 RepID=A0A0C3D8N3_OIDMZ|nr:glycoside hydrolase family 51 protein [Oidiodendron maius Zn]
MLPTKIFPLLAGIASAINIKVSNQGGNATSPLMYGIMFEDINHSGDGGIYAELIQNRAFQGSTEFPSTLNPWSPVGNTQLTLQNTSVPLSSALPISVNAVAASGTQGGLQNPGWWGFSVKSQTYKGSFWALGDYSGIFTLSLKSAVTSDVWDSVQIHSKSKPGQWVQHAFTLHPKAAPNTNNTFVLEFEGGKGSLNLNLISLFPPTYNNRPNGLRPDLMAGLKGLNPSFLRMPGGNNLEGDSYGYRWRWDRTIGPLTQRPGRPGTWGYPNTDGLGLIEYLQWCDDLAIEPILAIWSGVYLGGDAIPQADLGPYVEEAMNELEFIMGSTNTKYGALRASLGYPNPWMINYVEVGNEDNLADYTGYGSYRFRMFHDAIRAAYPNISIISSTGDYSAVAANSSTDYHNYERPNIFASQFHLFDHADRTHPILLGEYAAVQFNAPQADQGVDWSGAEKFMPFPNWVGAVGETIYTLGAERNGDIVIGCSYAPGFQNLNSYQWTPDLVSFNADPDQDVFSTSYYAIQLLSSHRYTHIAPMTADTAFGPAFFVAGYDEGTQDYTFKATVYNTTAPVPFDISFAGLNSSHSTATLTVLNAPDGLSSNTPGGSNVVRRETYRLTANGGVFSFSLNQYDIAVLTTKYSS